MTGVGFPRESARDLVRRALDEDLGERGDITTNAAFSPGREVSARLVLREPAVLAGLPVVDLVAEEMARRSGERAEIQPLAADGDRLTRGAGAARIVGGARNVLAGERVMLNIVARLSGIATATRRAVDELEGLACEISDTRKTTPGIRALEKYAVRVGGGVSHRATLDELILVKDNHKQLAGGIRPVLSRIRDGGHDLSRAEVEVESLEELDVALDFGCGWVMLDNMDVEHVAEAVRRVGGRCRIEVSGGLRPGSLRAFAETGADRLSLGVLTHGSRSVDVALDHES